MDEEALKSRKSEYPIQKLLLSRWSQRAMSGESITDEELHSLFEAARWAPSSYNNQPWRFIYAKKDSPYWPHFYDLLIDFNKEWVKNADVLILACSAKNFAHNNKPCITHSFDTGSAWMSLALEAFHRGLVVHGMQGFDYDKAKTVLKVPNDVNVEAMIAVGRPAPKDVLPKEIEEKETPSSRNPISSFVFEGTYKS